MSYTTAEKCLFEPSVWLGTSMPACHRPPMAESCVFESSEARRLKDRVVILKFCAKRRHLRPGLIRDFLEGLVSLLVLLLVIAKMMSHARLASWMY